MLHIRAGLGVVKRPVPFLVVVSPISYVNISLKAQRSCLTLKLTS